ncbi:prepilin-type N-terminal cleavage/methylation domain-containing protein [Candidatus Dependentiae bacterium]|nr:prepilin-type N-terminal cleavage/methylation domain-containing protein [Candidatus Dependentiae bacterium]
MKYYLKPGFSIIELVIGLMISSIFLTAALTMYNQISKSCNKIQSITSQDLSIMILQRRMTQDLLGLSPVWFTQADITKKQNKNSEQKNPDIKENNYFYAQTKDGQLDFMTFVTTNTLQAYPTAEHRIARIVYILKEDSKKENFFILQRKEEGHISNEFNPTKIKDGAFYTVTENIKKCKIEYGSIETSEKEWNFKWVEQWTEQQEKEKKDEKEKESKLPNIIRITILLQESAFKPETQHVFYCMIPQTKNVSLKSIAKKRYEKESEATQTNLSNASSIMDRIQNAAKQSAIGSTHA